MTNFKPLSSMITQDLDIATFFRLPIIKDLSKLDYCIWVFRGMVAPQTDLVLDMAQGKLEAPHL